jgi:cell wall-associated NlpC family hydrolase
MRRAIVVLSAVLIAVTFSSIAAVSVRAQATDQYDSAGAAVGALQPDEATSAPPPDEPTKESPGRTAEIQTDEVISQGSIGGEAPSQEAAARAAADLAEEESLPDYSDVVDNTTEGRFSAPGSKTVEDATAHGGSYAAVGKSKSASFRVEIPTESDYSVYAWWPAVGGKAAGTARYSIPVVGGDGGTETEKVAQGRDGGLWIKVGTYRMAAGQQTIKVVPVGGKAAADAVAVVRGEVAAPPEDSYATTGGASRSEGDKAVTSKAASSRRAVVRDARKWLGTPYRYATCTRARMSCTCLTKRAWAPNGHKIGMTEAGQWRYEPSRKVPKSSLNPGDIVFFKEGGSNSITHVAIYSGRGNIVHASSYYRYKKVVESKMKYVTGYFGASRLNPR